MSSKNSAQGTARTHEIVIFPRDAAFAHDRFYAQRESPLAMPDPAHVASTEVMGPWHPKDTTNFARAESVIEDFFQRAVFINQTVFPPNGYLGYGSYPYANQSWTLRKPTGSPEVTPERWYPTVHRIAKGLEYNLKRAVWVQAARMPDPKYWYYAQRNARFLHDMMFMNAPCNAKPYATAGTIALPASWNSPFYWGNAGYIWWGFQRGRDPIRLRLVPLQ